MKYIQKKSNAHCLSSLSSALFDSGLYRGEKVIASLIKEFLVCESKGYADIIWFSNDIIFVIERNKGEQCCHYNMLQCKKRG